MSHWLGFTNHKLYQCRLLLQQAQQTSEPVALQHALQDAALYLLRDAYVSYLHELAEQANYYSPVESLDQLLQAAPVVTGEMKELQQLQQDSFSWLAAFLQAVVAVGKADNAVTPVTPVQPGAITLVEESQPGIEIWLNQLTQLIDLQRENSLES